MSALTVICRQCRRIQAGGDGCVECNARALAAWPAEHDSLRHDAIVGVGVGHQPAGAGWLGLTFTVLLMIAFGVVGGVFTPFDHDGGAIVGVVLGGAAGYRLQYHRLKARRARRHFLPAPAPARLALPAARDVRSGTARPFERTLASLVTGTPCLASSAVARRDSDGKEVFSRVSATDFWLDGDDGAVLIRGVVTLRGVAGAPVPADSAAARAALAIPDGARLSLDEVTVEEVVLAPGARLAAEGTLTDELVAGVGYRDTSARVMRGVAGAPVVIVVGGSKAQLH